MFIFLLFIRVRDLKIKLLHPQHIEVANTLEYLAWVAHLKKEYLKKRKKKLFFELVFDHKAINLQFQDMKK